MGSVSIENIALVPGAHLTVCIYACLFAYLIVCLPVCLRICLFVCVFDCLFACLFAYLIAWNLFVLLLFFDWLFLNCFFFI